MKDKQKILIISVVAVFILILITILSLYFFTDIFKSNKEIFNKYIVKAQSESTGTSFIKAYMDAKVKEYINSNSTSTDINLYEINAINIEEKTKIIGLNSTSLKDVNLKQDYKIFKLSDTTNEIATIKYVRDGDLRALSADNILTRYVSVDINNIKSLVKKFGVENTDAIPEKIGEVDYSKLISINETTVNTLKEKYFGIIINNIEEEKYSKVKNADKTETLTLTLTNQDVANILEKILQEAQNDETLLNVIKEKINSAGYDMEISEIQNGINEALNNLSTITIPEGQLKISLVIKDKEIIKYIIETPEIEYGYTKIEAQIIEFKFENDNRIVINIKSAADEYRVDITYLNNNNIITIDAKVYNVQNGTESEMLSLKNEILNYNTDKLTETINVNIMYGNEKYELDVKKDTIFKQDLQIEKLTTENSTRIDLMTEEQLKSFISALTQRIMQLYGKQMNNIALQMTIF